jgi:hypothetical protein
MKVCRVFLVGFAIITWFCLSGLTILPNNEVDLADKHGEAISIFPSIEVSSEQLQEKKLNENIVKVRSKKRIRAKAVNQKESIIRNELDHPLDLSIPFKSTEKLDVDKKWLIPHQALDVFAVDPNKKARSLELNGDLLMSPDPQPEKRKSVDGAGIVINIKP